MSTTFASPPASETETVEQRFVMEGIHWDAYVTICDALEDHSGVRMIYDDGRLTFMGKSRRHEKLAELLGNLVTGIAVFLRIECEPSGEATYRRRLKEAAIEGDRTYHFGDNAVRMRGAENYDFELDPPPDLAIEVEVSHAADDAVAAWGRLGVTEVWRFEAATSTCTFWNRLDHGSYEQVATSNFLPLLAPADVDDQIRRAIELGFTTWQVQLEQWVRDVIRPRLDANR